MMDVAYILADWENHCTGLRKTAATMDEGGFLEFLSADDIPSKSPRQRRRASVVWSWYKFVVRIGAADHRFESVLEEISAPMKNWDPDVSELSFQPQKSSSTAKAKIPSSDQGDLILATLAEHHDPFIAERDWLLGRAELETGLRAMGVWSLSLTAINKMLMDDGIIKSWERIESIGSVKSGRDDIRRRVIELYRSGRTANIIKVTEKGNKSREVEIPIDLTLAIINYICIHRSKVLSDQKVRPDHGKLWVSKTTGQGLNLGTIKDIVAKRGFRKAKISGSGHKLRALFLTNKCIELVRKARRRFGENFDNWSVINDLSQIAGHSHWSTLRVYLDRAKIVTSFDQ